MDGDYERYLYDRLTVLRREYEKAAAPIIKQLVDLKALYPPQPIVLEDLTPEQIECVKAAMKSRGVI
jgi:hypothetical protein